MKDAEFERYLETLSGGAECLAVDDRSRIVIVSDLHLGNGKERDDSLRNVDLVTRALSGHYFPEGFLLVLNGDIEELHKFRYGDIRRAHADSYAVFDRFAAAGRIRKLVGNHDEDLVLDGIRDYPLAEALRLDHAAGTFLCYHGHQSSGYYTRFGGMAEFFVRYFARPLGVRNSSRPMTNTRRRGVERKSYAASKNLGLASVIGHTHRPLFESLSKYDQLRFKLVEELESWASEGPARARPRKTGSAKDGRVDGESADSERHGSEIRLLVAELRRLSKKRDREGAGSLYDSDGIPVPCLFNSGCATGKAGFTCVELSGGNISLNLWTIEGQNKVRPWIEKEAIARSDHDLSGVTATRYTLRTEPISLVFAKLRLLSEKIRA